MRAFFHSALLFAATGFVSVCADTVPGMVLPLHDVEVSFSVAGIVSEVLVQEGDTVRKGQPMVRLEDAVERLEVDRAAKVLEKAKFDHEATEKLYEDKVATREAALAKRIDYDLAVIQLKAGEERLRQRTLTAPLSGIVVKVDKEPGEAALLNEPVVQIVHIDQVYVQFYVEPAQLGNMKQDAQVQFSVPSLTEANRFTGMVVFIDPRMDAESGLYRIKLLLENPGLRLKAGMRAEAEIGTRNRS